MKRVRYYLCFLVCFFVTGSVSAADPVKMWGQLQVKGNQLCSESGDSVSLRGGELRMA